MVDIKRKDLSGTEWREAGILRRKCFSRRVIGAFGWIACWVLLAGPGPSRAAGLEPAAVDRTSGVKAAATYQVGRQDILRTILISGELEAEQSREISCPRIRSGFASTITFMAEEGSSVREGDRILEFDSSNLVSSKAEAERRLDEAKLTIQKTAADLAATRCDLENALQLAEGQLKVAQLYGAIPKELLPQNDFQRYQMELERAQLTLQKAQERLQNHDAAVPAQMGLVEVQKAEAELELRKIETDLNLLRVNAPQNGIVIYGDNWRENRKIQVGDAVYPGMTVMSLPDLSSMRVLGYVYDTELRFLRTGEAARFGLVAVPGRSWTGKVVSLTSVAGRKGFASDHKVFKAIVDLDAQEPALFRPGMTARIEIPVTVATDVLSVPRELLGLSADGSCFVLKAGGADQPPVRQSVEVGASGDEWIEVLDGLGGGETLLPLDRQEEAK